jgi:hypothetical protein
MKLSMMLTTFSLVEKGRGGKGIPLIDTEKKKKETGKKKRLN